MKLPESLREQLKIPLGVLLPESDVTLNNILKYFDEKSYLITVGDRTTEKMIKFGIVPSLQIIDTVEKREKREAPKISVDVIDLKVENPSAEITDQSINTIKQAFSMNPPIRMIVNGEEDLLVIPVCIHAPENAVVLYGQPNEGLVIVKVTSEIRNKTQTLLDLME